VVLLLVGWSVDGVVAVSGDADARLGVGAPVLVHLDGVTLGAHLVGGGNCLGLGAVLLGGAVARVHVAYNKRQQRQ
jgi:hypothetical protein